MIDFKQKSFQKIAGSLVMVVFISILFVLFSLQNRERIFAQTEEYVKDSTNQTAARIDDVLLQSLDNIKMMSYWFGESLESPEVSKADLQELTDSSDFDYVRFVDAAGNNMAADGRTNDARDREYYLEGMAGKSGMSITLESRITSETLVNFYTPLRYKGEIIGVLRGVFLANDRMQDLLKSSFFGVSSSSFLCMSDGVLIAQNSESEQFSEKLKNNLEDEEHDKEKSGEIIQDALEHGNSASFIYRIDGEAGNGYVTKLESNDWFLIQTFPIKVTGEMFREANSAGVFFQIALIFVFVVYIIIILVSNRRQNKKLLNENRDMNDVIQSIPRLYEWFVEIDLEKGTYRYMLNKNPAEKEVPSEGEYHLLKEYILNSVREQTDKIKMERFMDIFYIKRHLDASTVELKMEYLFSEGEEEWRRVCFICLEREKGIPTRVLLTRQNISEAKREEIAKQNVFREAKMAAEKSNKAKSTFLFNMSHDIRTPMNAIIGFANMAEKKLNQPEVVREYIHKIQASSDILLNIINDVLDLARIESGKAALHFTPHNIYECFQGMRDMFEETMKEAGLHFISEIHVQNPYVLCDNLRMNQILLNLLSNACKFTPEGGTVWMSCSQLTEVKDGKAEYEVIVKDTGIGMSEEFLSRIFDAFERERTSTVSGIQGTGLGLSIVKNLVDMMEGTIEVKSRQNEGTEIRICIAVEVLSETDMMIAQEEKSEESSVTGTKILVVEDNELNREIARELLISEGYEVDEAEDGQIAVDKIARSEPGDYDLVLMDIQMPKMNGFEATRAIRHLSDTRLADIPIIAVTANAFEEDKKAVMEAGMNGHIGKPIDVKQMKREINRVLGNHTNNV